jgi:hypothetical protein
MKRFMYLGLTVLLVTTATISAAKAETTSAATKASTSELTPFDLAIFAYRGSFSAQGIPSYNTFYDSYRTGRIDAKQVVQAAVDAKRLSADVLNDRGYLGAVDAQIRSLDPKR